MPASSRSAMPRSSAPAPTRSACWPSTGSGTSRSPACSSPRRSRARSASPRGLVLLRTTGLTLLMLTLCTMALLEEAANMAADCHRRLRRPRQPADQAAVRHLRVQPAVSQHAISLRPRRAAGLLRVRAHAGLFAIRPEPDRHPREHAAHARGRRAGADAADHLLHDLGRDRRHRGRAVGAGQCLCEPERCSASTAPRRC